MFKLLVFFVAVSSIFGASLPQGKSYCKTLTPLVRQILTDMPKDKVIPCDAEHIVEIGSQQELAAVIDKLYPTLVGMPDRRDAMIRYNAAAYGFVASTHVYPVYINAWKLKAEGEAFASKPAENASFPYCFVPLLVHERRHAEGEGLESLAFQEELETATALSKKGYIPQGMYNFPAVQQAIVEAKNRETSVGGKSPDLGDLIATR